MINTLRIDKTTFRRATLRGDAVARSGVTTYGCLQKLKQSEISGYFSSGLMLPPGPAEVVMVKLRDVLAKVAEST